MKIGVAGGNFTLRLLGISGLTAEDSSHIVRFLQSQTIPISNPYAVTCLPRKELQAMFSGFCDTNPAPFPARFSLCSVMFELCDMVVRVGLAPTLFLMWQIYSLLRSLLSHLTLRFLVGATGLEPASHELKVRCKTTLLRSNKWSGRRDSNPHLDD